MRTTLNFIITGLLLTILSCISGVVRAQGSDETDIVPLASEGALQFGELQVNSNRVGLYEKFEITFDLNGSWENPFDPDQIKVDAVFNSPDGKQLVVPAFYYQDYRSLDDNQLEKVGDPVWKVRFTPTAVGEYKYELVANNKVKELRSPSGVLNTLSYGAHHGFIRVSKTNPHYFEYDDGTSFFGVSMDRGAYQNSDWERIYKRFAHAGGNHNRLFITGGNFSIEELNPPPEREDRGLGKMNLHDSWNLDKVIELGEYYGISHQLALTNQYNFNHQWASTVFNKANGGIVESAREYFTSEEAMRFLERRFRYIIARWGYSPAVFSWNLWNEYSAMPGYKIATAIKWHQRMARYISSIDVFGHIIHTNDGKLNGANEMHALPEMELVSTNSYGIKNIAHVAEVWTRRMTKQFNKPYILAEFGPGHGGSYAEADPERRMVHDGLWSPVMSGSASTGMAWEGSWLDHERFYTYLRSVADVVDGIPFHQRQWTPVQVSSFKFQSPQDPYHADVIVEGWSGNFGLENKKGSDEFFYIDEKGNIAQHEALQAVLTGPAQQNSRSTSSVSYKMQYPVDGEFVVYVTELRDTKETPRLSVKLDGKEVMKEELVPLEQETRRSRAYNKYYSIRVPKGKHDIRVENTGGGSFVTAFELKNYVYREGPDLEVRGIQTNDHILLWLKNQKFTLLHEMNKMSLEEQPEGILEMQTLSDGLWMAKWINTISGGAVKTELVKANGRKLVLNTPEVKESVVVRLQKIK